MVVKDLIQILKRFDPYSEVHFVNCIGWDIPLDGIEELESFREVQFSFDIEN